MVPVRGVNCCWFNKARKGLTPDLKCDIGLGGQKDVARNWDTGCSYQAPFAVTAGLDFLDILAICGRNDTGDRAVDPANIVTVSLGELSEQSLAAWTRGVDCLRKRSGGIIFCWGASHESVDNGR